MRQTRSDSPALIKHRPLDCSCVGIDSEDLPNDSFQFDHDLVSDMSAMNPKDLARHYPELTFAFVKGSKRPKGHDYVAGLPGGWRTADWRHTS